MASMGLCRLDVLSLSTVHVFIVSSSGTGPNFQLSAELTILLLLSKGSPVQASRTTSVARLESRDIPCESPLEDDQVVRRSLLSFSAFCSRFRGVWSSCSLPCSAPSAPFRRAYDVVLAGHVRTCADTIMSASFVHALRGSGACGSARLWSTGNWIRFLVCFKLGSKVITSWFTER